MISLAMLTLGVTFGYAPTRDIGPQLDSEREARVMRLGKQLRCAVCQGVAISDSPASMAQAQLAKVRELVAEGQSDDEILKYFVARYGEWVLLEPTKEGLNSVLWAGPLLLLGLGLVVIWLQPKRKAVVQAQAAAASPTPGEATASTRATTAPSGDEALLAKLRADLEK